MNVTVDAAGRVVEAEVVRSSRSRLLDQQALAIVRSAAPFGPFSSAMRRQADQIVVTSRFRFTRDDGVIMVDVQAKHCTTAQFKGQVDPKKALLPETVAHVQVSSKEPRVFGGNMDNWRLGKGATMYYPVAVPGAMFSVGDPLATVEDETKDAFLRRARAMLVALHPS